MTMGVRDVLPVFTDSGNASTDDSDTHIECRECGSNLTGDTDVCPECGGSVAVYEI